MRFILILFIFSLCSCVVFKNRKSTEWKFNNKTMDSTFVRATGIKKQYSLKQAGELWRSDTFGCRGLRAQIFIDDSNFTEFIYSLNINDLLDYLGKPNYVAKFKSSNKLINYIIYITDGSKNWCAEKKYRNTKRIKYVMENRSYMGLRIQFDKSGKVISYFWSIFG